MWHLPHKAVSFIKTLVSHLTAASALSLNSAPALSPCLPGREASDLTRQPPKGIHRDMMSSEPKMGYKRSAPDAPDTSDDDGFQLERGKEAEAAGPKLDQADS